MKLAFGVAVAVTGPGPAEGRQGEIAAIRVVVAGNDRVVAAIDMEDRLVGAPAGAGVEDAPGRIVEGQRQVGLGRGPGVLGRGIFGAQEHGFAAVEADFGPVLLGNQRMVAVDRVDARGIGIEIFLGHHQPQVRREVAEVATGLPGPAEGLEGLEQPGFRQGPEVGVGQKVLAAIGVGDHRRHDVADADAVVADALGADALGGGAIGQVITVDLIEPLQPPGIRPRLALDGEGTGGIGLGHADEVPQPPMLR